MQDRIWLYRQEIGFALIVTSAWFLYVIWTNYPTEQWTGVAMLGYLGSLHHDWLLSMGWGPWPHIAGR